MRHIKPADTPLPASITAVTERTNLQSFLSKTENTSPVEKELYELKKGEEILF